MTVRAATPLDSCGVISWGGMYGTDTCRWYGCAWVRGREVEIYFSNFQIHFGIKCKRYTCNRPPAPERPPSESRDRVAGARDVERR